MQRRPSSYQIVKSALVTLRREQNATKQDASWKKLKSSVQNQTHARGWRIQTRSSFLYQFSNANQITFATHFNQHPSIVSCTFPELKWTWIPASLHFFTRLYGVFNKRRHRKNIPCSVITVKLHKVRELPSRFVEYKCTDIKYLAVRDNSRYNVPLGCHGSSLYTLLNI